MSQVVIDASVILRWAFDDEPDREGAARVAAGLQDGSLRAIAPPTFLAEVAGVLVRAIRAGRMRQVDATEVMEALVQIGVDQDDPRGYATAAMGIALGQGLHVQDAMYVETARRWGAPLVSADRGQVEAARRVGVVALGPDELPRRIPDSP